MVWSGPRPLLLPLLQLAQLCHDFPSKHQTSMEHSSPGPLLCCPSLSSHPVLTLPSFWLSHSLQMWHVQEEILALTSKEATIGTINIFLVFYWFLNNLQVWPKMIFHVLPRKEFGNVRGEQSFYRLLINGSWLNYLGLKILLSRLGLAINYRLAGTLLCCFVFQIQCYIMARCRRVLHYTLFLWYLSLSWNPCELLMSSKGPSASRMKVTCLFE